MSQQSKGIVFLVDRITFDSKTEYESEVNAAATAGFTIEDTISSIGEGAIVLARHYAWPFPSRLDRELKARGAVAVNGRKAYEFADNPMSWSDVLRELTPRTWTRFVDLPESGQFILKGAKADKSRWDRMYAEGRDGAIRLWSELRADSGFRNQEIVIREYEPLVRLGSGQGGCPISEEYRVFCYRDRVLSRGFYWNEEDCDCPVPTADVVPCSFLAECMRRIVDCGYIDYYTLDVARTEGGDWIVIEISDGQRAGLCGNSPDVLYSSLFEALTERD